ncbi:MAG: carbon-nitrogen family hydrolase [Selenomonadaceae bacterium]|nr:carbon-nitrogen family hydrolase [Selenomonadaceae bacterium]
MNISILQFKPTLGKIIDNFKLVDTLMKDDSIKSTDVVVLPELWSTGFYPKPVKDFADKCGYRTCNFLSELAIKNNINIIGGTVIVEDDGNFYNRCFTFNRQGKIIAVYDKIHLFSMSKENNVFKAGHELPIFEIDGIKTSVVVCYDIRFPELIREAALSDIEILFIPAAWPLKRLDHWQILTKSRAIENQIFVVAANSAGYSSIIDPSGTILIEAKTDSKIVTVDVNFNIRTEIKDIMDILADCNKFQIKKEY